MINRLRDGDSLKDKILKLTDTAVAFCRAFLLTKDTNRENARIFCRAFLLSIYGDESA